MTKGKKWTLRLLGVAALALLICLCLLGSTMARYTSSGNGSGSLTVALWDLETARIPIATSKISPSDKPYYATAGDTNSAQERTNQSAWIEAFTMDNNSDVAADVELDLGGGLEFTWPNTLAEGETEYTGSWAWGSGWQDGEGHQQTDEYGAEIMTNMGTQEDFKNIVEKFGVLDIQLGLSANEQTEPEAAMEEGTTIKLLAKGATASDDDTKEGRTTDSEVVWAQVVWTSIYETEDTGLLALVPDAYFDDEYLSSPGRQGTASDKDHIDWASFSDDVDTILGMYVTDISFAVTWTAYQASVLPPTTT